MNECFLARLGGRAGSSRAIGALVVGACLIAAVKLNKVESAEIQKRSPRVRAAIADALAIAKMIAELAVNK
jgi:hypothetical protein